MCVCKEDGRVNRLSHIRHWCFLEYSWPITLVGTGRVDFVSAEGPVGVSGTKYSESGESDTGNRSCELTLEADDEGWELCVQ